MTHAYISGIGSHAPAKVVTNEDLVLKYHMDTSHEWIVKRTGIKERRFAEIGQGPADLAEPASRDALTQAGLEPTDIDMILFATLSPEMAFPGSGVLLQEKLGMVGVPAMDIRNQCSGFVYGLGTGVAMIESGAAKNILLVGSEVQSAAMDFTTRGQAVGAIFGDGAGAVVLSATEEDRGVRYWKLGADGRYAESLAQRIWDTRERPFIPRDENGNGIVVPELMWAQMDGRQVFKHAVEKMTHSLVAMLWDAGLTTDDLDLVLFHQANMRINQVVQDQLNLPGDKVPHTIDRYGNTTAATIPMLLADVDARGGLERGMKVAMVAFGSGFTWGSALIDW